MHTSPLVFKWERNQMDTDEYIFNSDFIQI